MQGIVIIAGPNGAGKTSFANEVFRSPRLSDVVFLNADEMARGLGRESLEGGSLDLAAGRRMLEALEDVERRCVDFVVETTLATQLYARRIPIWRRNECWISLIYLRLPSVEASIERVARRVAAGGHSVPEEVIRRRFARSLSLLENVHKPLVDDWQIHDSMEGEFKFVDAGAN